MNLFGGLSNQSENPNHGINNTGLEAACSAPDTPIAVFHSTLYPYQLLMPRCHYAVASFHIREVQLRPK